MIELAPQQRSGLKRLFAGLPYMPTVARAVVEEGFGRASADQIHDPAVGLLQLDFNFLAGDASHPAAQEVARDLTNAVVATPAWRDVLRDTWGADLIRSHARVSFRDARFDVAALQRMVKSVPQEFEMVRIERDDQLDSFSALGPCLTGNFPSREDYLRRGLGFGIRGDGQFIAAASSFCVAGKDLEFEIQTHPDFRRRGLATAVAARLILHCQGHGITPHWDAHNPPSAALAEKLGFRDGVAYETYWRDAPAHKPAAIPHTRGWTAGGRSGCRTLVPI